MLVADEEYTYYLDSLKNELNRTYSIASEAKKKGFDPEDYVEIKIAKDVASRVEALVGPPGISKIIRKMEQLNLSREDIAFTLAAKITKGEIIQDSVEKCIEQAVRTSICVLTEGVLVAPTEGISKVKIKNNPDGTNYIAIYFTGPIRSAGGTVAALAVLLADYARKQTKIGDFRATDSELERYVEEINIYEARVYHLQYKPSDDDLRWIIKNCPICIDGEPTEEREVSVYRDLARIETNRIRGGVPLVLCDGIAQKSAKIYRYSKKFGLGWDWLEKLIKIKHKETFVELKPDYTYLDGLVGGRPIFSYPMAKGGFRLRYGKSRTNGLMAKNIHPATMFLLDNFIAIGTHIKIERPGKGAVLLGCESIEPPIVRLKDKSVLKIKTVEKAKELCSQIEKILFLGDMLISYEDFLKSGHPLLPSAWCEEWWIEECKAKNLQYKKFENAEQAFEFSKKYGIPLHPDYVYFWHDITHEQLQLLVKWLSQGNVEFHAGKINSFVLPFSQEKEILEELGVEHRVQQENVFLEKDETYTLFTTLGLTLSSEGRISGKIFEQKYTKEKTILQILTEISEIEIKAKAPLYIGARMGRPEKAKERKMEGGVNVLFPTGSPKNRGLIKIYKTLKAKEEQAIFLELFYSICPKCQTPSHYTKCKTCNTKTIPKYHCPKCGKYAEQKNCCTKTQPYNKRAIDFVEIIESLKKQYGSLPEEIKGVKGLSNITRIPERLEKGIFRAKEGVYVFRDGTCRFDGTDAPLTHFKPKEIQTPIEKLHELGYKTDYKGNELKHEDQLVALKPQDIILSENGGDYFVKVAKFLNDILTKLYSLQPFYNVKERGDLLGHLFLGLSPHTSSGVLVRLIGFTKANVTFGHPYFHAAKRRNCDGDEDSVILLLDALLNFSRHYIASESRGGTMDTPITLSTVIEPKEVDDEIHGMETVFSYPREFYYATEKFTHPSEVKIKVIKDILDTTEQYNQIGFTHEITKIDQGPLRTAYVSFDSIPKKIEAQFSLQARIRAVNIRDSAERLILSHFIPDLYGNLRSFSRQTFRCTNCNGIYRRVPLIGKCIKCGGKLILTINKGGIKKYLEISQKISNEYELPLYIKQRLELIKKEIEDIFEDEKIKQMGLADFM